MEKQSFLAISINHSRTIDMIKAVKSLLAVFCLGLGLSSYAFADAHEQEKPRRDKLFEEHFGKKVPDPYRWMENADDPDLVEWVESQNEHAKFYLRGDLYEEITQEVNQIFQPQLRATANHQVIQLMQQQNVLTTMQKWRPEVSVNLTKPQTSYSPNHEYYVQMTSDSGSDLQRLEVYNNFTGEKLSDVLMVKFAQVIWEADDASFIYVTNRDGRLGDYRPAIFRHVIGTSQPDDELIYLERERGVGLSMLELDGRYFLVRQAGYDGGISEIDIASGKVTEIVEQTAGLQWPFSIEGDFLYVVKYGDSPMGSIVRIDIHTGEMVTEMEELAFAIQGVRKFGDDYYMTVLDDAISRLFIYRGASQEIEEMSLPAEGNAIVFGGIGALYIYITSYSQPDRYWLFNEQTKSWDLVFEGQPLDFELDSFRTYYTAHNGQQVPIWIVKAKDTELTSDTPVRLYGYGGFAVNILPRFDQFSMPWYKRGGVTAYVTLPGGLEYGEEWHQAGMLHNKGNVFRDFAAAAKHLIDSNYTSPSHIVASGGSNGGLLVGATINRYPHLFAAGVPEVGVMDMTRYQLFTAGKWWVREYGDRDIKTDFKNLYSVSPYHNIKDINYPAMFVMTADFDDRVVPAHSYKYAARLQHHNQSDKPILMHSERWGSHGGHGNIERYVEYHALRWTFMMKALGMDN